METAHEIIAGVVGAAVVLLFGVSWPEALLLGAATVPTDAAAVSVLLRVSRIGVPSRVSAALEVESGLNDPMSVFLTVGLVGFLTAPKGWARATRRCCSGRRWAAGP